MAFTINDLQDLTRLLATHPEWLSEVRRLVLTKELLALPGIVRSLAEAQRRTEQRLNELAEAQRRTEETVRRLVNQMAEVRGELLENRFRTKAHAYFGRWLRRVRVVPFVEIEGQPANSLSDAEVAELSFTDILVRGRPRIAPEADEVWLAVEVSSVVDAGDIYQVKRRATLLQSAGFRARP